MAMNRIGLAAILSIVCSWHVVAIADEAPAAADTCTLEQQRKTGEDCLLCDAWRGDVAKCQKRLGPRGFERRCRGSGTSVWSEVWCKAAGGAEHAPTPRAPSPGR